MLPRGLGAHAVIPPDLRNDPGLPFTHYALQLPQDPSSESIYSAYNKLYSAASAAVRSYISSTDDADLVLHPSEGGSSPISYNLAMTTSSMAIIPRRKEGAAIHDKQGKRVGTVEPNGTVLAGTLMVKLEGEWDALRNDEFQLDDILKAIGIPR